MGDDRTGMGMRPLYRGKPKKDIQYRLLLDVEERDRLLTLSKRWGLTVADTLRRAVAAALERENAREVEVDHE